MSASEDPRPTPEVALVTGAARRIGRTIATTLHAAGYRVAIHYHRSESQARGLAGELGAQRAGSAAPFQADLRHADAARELVSRVHRHFERLDLLVNNASAFYPTPVGPSGAAQFDELFATNVRAPFLIAQAAAPLLGARTGGSIVNIGDIHGERPLRGYALYSTTKAALAMLTRALAVELAPRVRVNAVSPGAILWPTDGADPLRQARVVERIALGRLGTPEDIARAVLYLAREAPYVTGQILAVDGGSSLDA